MSIPSPALAEVDVIAHVEPELRPLADLAQNDRVIGLALGGVGRGKLGA